MRSVDSRGNQWNETAIKGDLAFLEATRAEWMDVPDRDIAASKRLITGLKSGKDIGRFKGKALADFIYVFSPTKHFFACTRGEHKGKLLVHDAECDSGFADDATFDLVLMQRDCM